MVGRATGEGAGAPVLYSLQDSTFLGGAGLPNPHAALCHPRDEPLVWRVKGFFYWGCQEVVVSGGLVELWCTNMIYLINCILSLVMLLVHKEGSGENATRGQSFSLGLRVM